MPRHCVTSTASVHHFVQHKQLATSSPLQPLKRCAWRPAQEGRPLLGFLLADAVSRGGGRTAEGSVTVWATTGDPKARQMIGYAPSTAAEDGGSRSGAGAVMLAVDELALRVANGDSATAFVQARSRGPMERRSPSRS